MTPETLPSASDYANAAAPPSEAASFGAASPAANPPALPPRRFAIQKRVRTWIQTLHRDPSAEERAAMERRARLLVEINRTVAEAPDDIPIKDLVARLNRHHDD